MSTHVERMRPARGLSGLARMFLVALVPLAAGCRSVPHPGVVVEHLPGRGSDTCQVPYSATYALFAVDRPPFEAVPLERATVERRAHVGFVRKGDGSLVAYANGRQIPLEEGRYVWRITPETQRTRGELVSAGVGNALTTAGQGLVSAGAFSLKVAGALLYGFARAGGHN